MLQLLFKKKKKKKKEGRGKLYFNFTLSTSHNHIIHALTSYAGPVDFWLFWH